MNNFKKSKTKLIDIFKIKIASQCMLCSISLMETKNKNYICVDLDLHDPEMIKYLKIERTQHLICLNCYQPLTQNKENTNVNCCICETFHIVYNPDKPNKNKNDCSIY